MASVNLFLALVAHVIVGLPLVLWVPGAVVGQSSKLWALWALCAFGLWIVGIVRGIRRLDAPGSLWGAIVGSWLVGALGPIGVAAALYRHWSASHAGEEKPVNPDVQRRLEAAERRVAELAREVAEIRRIAQAPHSVQPLAPLQTAPPPPPPAGASPRSATAPPPKLPPTRPTQPRGREPSRWERGVEWGDLLGAKGLAWAGGIVTVLGVVFFFVLAVNRGWIGPAERVGLGALASLLVFGGGLWLHRRFGPTYSAYGAVGAGLAGGYATLVAAAALYGLLSDLGALAAAAAIGSVGLATSLAWRSELVAGIGLVGATLVPMMVLFEEDLSPLGTAFAGIVFAATATVAVSRQWQWLLGLGFLASLPQITILVAHGAVTDWDRLLLAGIFVALYTLAGAALHRTRRDDGLPSLSATLVIVAGVLAGATSAALFAGEERGWIMLAAGGAFGAAAAGVFPRDGDRDLSALMGAVALALAAVGGGAILDGPSLAIAWAAEAAVLAWLAQRIDEPRYAIASLAYLGAAAVDAVVEAPLRNLYAAATEPAAGALAPLAVALGAAVVALYSRPWANDDSAHGFFALFAPLVRAFRGAHALWRAAAAWLGGTAGVYAVSLGTLALAQLVDHADVGLAFERGHVLVIALWGLIALGLVTVGRRIDSLQAQAGGLTLAAVTLVQAATFDVVELGGDRRGVALLVAAATLLATAFADELPLPHDGRLSIPAALFATATVGLATGGALQLTEGIAGRIDPQGVVLLAVAGFYFALAAAVFRTDRDFSTVLWAPALLVALFGYGELAGDTWFVLTLSGTAAALAFLRVAVDEERLAIGSACYLLLALAYALSEEAPPNEFFTANADPAAGVPAVLLVTAAGLAFAYYVGRARADALRPYFWTGAAVLGIYSASLSILGAFQWLGLASVETDFQRGHSAVSTFWGLIGLATLYVGLTRDLRALRLAGFGLFGLSLAKLFLYDLAFLSSITRALSFLAVGAVLLLAGFFYQRLTAAPPREAT